MKKVLLVIMMLLFVGCGEEKKEMTDYSSTQMLEPTPYAEVFPKMGNKPMLLEFGSTTCASCVKMGKILTRVKENYPQSEIYFINIYKDREAMENFKIQMIPTQVYVSKGGIETDRHIGGIEYENLIEKLKVEEVL
jgi:thioredoxin 1